MFQREVIAAFDHDISLAHDLVEHAAQLHPPAINHVHATELHDRLDHYMLPNLKNGRVHLPQPETSTGRVAYLPAAAFPAIDRVEIHHKPRISVGLSAQGFSSEKKSNDQLCFDLLITGESMRTIPTFVTTREKTPAALAHETIHCAQMYREPVQVNDKPPVLTELPRAHWKYDWTQLKAQMEAEAYSVEYALMSDTEEGASIRDEITLVSTIRNLKYTRKNLRVISVMNHLVNTGDLSAVRPPSDKIIDLLKGAKII